MPPPDDGADRGPTQLVVTLRSAAFAAAAARLGGPLELNAEVAGRLRFGERIELESTLQPAAEGGAGGGFTILQSLERDGMLLDAQALSRPVGEEVSYAEVVPLGVGRATVAAAESFSLRGGRPSDAILSGSMLLTFADEGALPAARNRLSDAPGIIARVERVPARRLVESVPGVAGAAWHIARTRADQARQVPGYLDGSQVSVAVIDSGVDAGHPLLAPGIESYTSSYPGEPRASTRDLIGHGTHVSGVIGARGEVDGISRARLRELKVFRDTVDRYQSLQRPDNTWFYVADSAPAERMFVLALGLCLDENVPVINFSLGYDTVHSKEAELFEGFERHGQAVVAATGNGGPGAPQLYPARYDSAFAVGALDRDDRAAGFSSSAPYMLVSAPGVDIAATMPTYDGAVEFQATIDANGVLVRGAPIPWSKRTGVMSGTSSAAPQVSAAAALWIAKHGRDLNRLRDALAGSARKLPEMGSAERTDRHGHGCLDILALLS